MAALGMPALAQLMSAGGRPAEAHHIGDQDSSPEDSSNSEDRRRQKRKEKRRAKKAGGKPEPAVAVPAVRAPEDPLAMLAGFMQAQASRGGTAGGIDPNMIVQMKMMEMLTTMAADRLKKGKKDKSVKKDKRESKGGFSDTTSGSSDSSDSDHRSKSKGFKAMHRRRKHFFKNPRPHVREYREYVRDKLHVTSPKQHWSFMEHSRGVRPVFRHMVGLWRVHCYVAQILQWCEDGEDQLIAPGLALLLRTLFQVGADEGSWDNAVHLMPLSDPADRERWGGSEDDLARIHEYRKCLAELELKVGQTDGLAPAARS